MGLFDSIANGIGDKIFNKSGDHKDLYCEKCKEFTDHVSISHADSLKEDFKPNQTTKKVTLEVIGKIGDINPLPNLLLGRPFKCSKCGETRKD